ncbi:MAG TPA: SRPBCC family protein [Baekduia sp.]|uniref:SRPBCC family protein n=1 Tax=Baekduia sp. TaxID=2600305 RepID=UPI002CE86927|nr:SRPBCC family protein [Baekduia sp.]HMJ33177.1 SRPBCC family protein [Baekduia sp.]
MLTTKTSRAETRSISIAAPPAAVLALVADPRRLPEWAPAFARGVQPDGDDWLIDTGEAQARITVRVSPEHGTVDLLSATDPTRGAFSRVVHNHDGSEYLFTLFFPDGTPETAISRQMATVEDELQAVRALTEEAAARGIA